MDTHFDDLLVSPLSEFIKIPNLSPNFDQEFYTNGLIEQAINLVVQHAEGLQIPRLSHTVTRLWKASAFDHHNRIRFSKECAHVWTS